jgi:hypothetical protein
LSTTVAAVDRVCAWLLAGRAALILGAVAAAALLLWSPAYCSRPWFRDIDTFATMARGWDLGVLPYRDVRAYNFPGHLVLSWVLGRLFGWDRTAPFLAADLALFGAFGGVLVAWSRRALGGAFPGVCAWMGLAHYLMSASYMMTAQRDWQAALLALMAAQTLTVWRPRWAVFASAGLFAMAITLRPHALLFAPAVAIGLWSRARDGRPVVAFWRAGLIWLGALAAFLCLALLPLAARGLIVPWIATLASMSTGHAYAAPALPELSRRFLEAAFAGWTPWVIAGLFILGAWQWAHTRGAGESAVDSHRRGATGVGQSHASWTCLVALLGACFWQAAHPVRHDYLSLPRTVLTYVGIAPLIAGLLTLVPGRGFSAALGVAAVLSALAPGLPATFRLDDSARGWGAIWRGREPERVPLGCEVGFGAGGRGRAYAWDDYRRVLAYLRDHKESRAPVANVLRQFPFPAINGPTGHPEVFRLEAGICWELMVGDGRDEELSAALASARGALVVWAPDEVPDTRLQLPKLTATIRRWFVPEARFGAIEVWHRADEVSP